jgi:hypothetical protein
VKKYFKSVPIGGIVESPPVVRGCALIGTEHHSASAR